MNENRVISIQDMIFEFRGQKVMLDHDLAGLYEVELRTLNQAVKRNIERFPDDFMFQLTQDEWNILRSQFVISRYNHGGRRYLPYVFTEQGVAMLSGLINSDIAINVNISIMRAFIKLRQYVHSYSSLSEHFADLRKLLMLHIDNMDYKFTEYDEAINEIINALNNLIEQPKETKRIGF